MAFGGFGPGSSVPNSHEILGIIHSDSTAHGVTSGDIIVGSGSTWTALGIGAESTFLTSSGGVPIWSNLPADMDSHNLLSARHSDAATTSTAPTNGGLIVGSGGVWHQLVAGAAGQVLESNGSGELLWSSPTTGTVSATLPVVDNALARWDGATGTLLQNSEVLVTDLGALTAAGAITASGDMISLATLDARTDLQVAGVTRLEDAVGVAGALTASGVATVVGNLTTSSLIIHSLEIVPGAWHLLGATELAVITSTGAAKQVVLPASASVGQKYVIKDGAGDAAAFSISVVASGGATIDGFAAIPIVADYSSLGFVWNGTEWNIV